MKATRDALGDQLVDSGKDNLNLIVLSADLGKATRISKFGDTYPDRFFEIGIAENNMIGIASGLSEYGYKVFVVSTAVGKDIANSSDKIGSILGNFNEVIGFASIVPKIPSYVKTIGSTTKLIFTGAIK